MVNNIATNEIQNFVYLSAIAVAELFVMAK